MARDHERDKAERWVIIRYRDPETLDLIQRERIMRVGIEPLREARSLAKHAGVRQGADVGFDVLRYVGDVTATIAGKSVTIKDLWVIDTEGDFVWEHA